jgi:hypothetical protein
MLTHVLDRAQALGLGWVALALLVSSLSRTLSLRLFRGRNLNAFSQQSLLSIACQIAQALNDTKAAIMDKRLGHFFSNKS